MRKIILFNMITLDGFFEGPNRDIGWHNVDDEFNEFAIEQLNSADGLIFGRVTYELMAAYWPTETVSTDDPIVAGKMNSIPKIVFSRTLEKAGWNNTRLVKDKAPEEISKLKQMPGRDLYIFGSAKISSTLANLGLIDEYRVIVNPVVLGAGTPLFRDLQNPISLRLSRTKVFRNGNDLLVYQPDK